MSISNWKFFSQGSDENLKDCYDNINALTTFSIIISFINLLFVIYHVSLFSLFPILMNVVIGVSIGIGLFAMCGIDEDALISTIFKISLYFIILYFIRVTVVCSIIGLILLYTNSLHDYLYFTIIVPGLIVAYSQIIQILSIIITLLSYIIDFIIKLIMKIK